VAAAAAVADNVVTPSIRFGSKRHNWAAADARTRSWLSGWWVNLADESYFPMRGTIPGLTFARNSAHPEAMNMTVNDPLGAVARLQAIRDQLAQRVKDCRRAQNEVTLIAVSKTFTIDEIWPTIADGGQLVFGENRVQEAQAKWPDLRARAEPLDRMIELHLIGPLQSNKAREAVETFDVIETVDREKIAAALSESMAKTGKRPKLFVQINTGAEPQKAGVLPEDADRFVALCRERHGLEISGLMCIPPHEEIASPHFALLSEIARRNDIAELSMGMSADWALAVQLGATYIRVGSGIFGSRTVPQ
jgi:pyridoxal phosphate enzyme (YggS family)